jgi:hypothetical protein
MKTSQRFWRGLFIIFFIVALCGGLALPIALSKDSMVYAAPRMQATMCSGTTITEWNFAGDVLTPVAPVGMFSTTGLPAETFVPGPADSAVSYTGWPSTLNTGVYIQLFVPTVARNSISIAFDYSVTSNGPTTLELHYSTNGSTFTLFDTPRALDNAAGFHNLSFDLSTIVALNNQPNTTFRLHAYGGSAPTLQLDNIIFTGNCLTPAELTSTASTATFTSTPVTPTATSTSTAASTSPASTASVVISEFRTEGPSGGNDEFIELYNPTSNWIDISGWKINASNDAGSSISTRATIPASTILRSGQYYLIVNNASSGGYSGSVAANLTYGTGITNGGGIALLMANNTPVDQVGMSTTSAYKEGTPLTPLSNPNRSYERLPGDFGNNCQDTNNNTNDFESIAPDPQNYATRPLRRCGNDYLDPVNTTTTITAHTPEQSIVNGNVSVTVSVTGGSPIPTGRVNITTSQTNVSCTINNLNSAGTGTCVVKFTSLGNKTITATYLGDNEHLGSTASVSHSVVVNTPTKVITRTPTRSPPPPLIAINEFVPRPGHDWNLDGVVNTNDEYIELINHGVIDVNLSGYSLDDEANIGSSPYRLPSVVMKPGDRMVFYGSETGLLLSDGGDGVRLLKPNGQLGDAYNYFVVRFPDQSYCRLPDNGGLDDWNQNCFPTPGLQNSLSGSSVNPPTGGGASLCPIADTLPEDFVYAECLPFGANIWNSAYWDKLGWFHEKVLPESPGKWPVFVD